MKIMGVVGKGSKPHVRAIEPGDVVGCPAGVKVTMRLLRLRIWALVSSPR